MRHLKKDSAFSAFFAILENSLERTRRCGRAVECTGLENRRRLIADREFESHRLRQENSSKYLIFRAFFAVSACDARLLYRRSPRRETHASSAGETTGSLSSNRRGCFREGTRGAGRCEVEDAASTDVNDCLLNQRS